MTKISRTLALCALISTFAGAQASITSLSNTATAYGGRFDTLLGSFASPFVTGSSVSDVDGFAFANTFTIFGSEYISTSGIYQAGVTTSSSTYAQMDGFFFAKCQASSNYPGAQAYAYEIGSDSATFSLDAPGVVTLKAYSTNATESGFWYQNNYLYLDGTYYQTAAVDGFYSINVGAGNHTAFFESQDQANAGTNVNATQSFANMSAYYTMTISSPVVPEPCSLGTLAVGVLAVIRRRRASA